LDCEKKMNTNGRVRDEEPNVATSFSGLAHDVIELSELQAQLFVHDVKNIGRKTRTSLILGVVGACVLLGSIPALLFGLAELFVEQFDWPRSAGFAVSAVIGMVVSAGFLVTARSMLSAGLSSMQRSRDEFNRNVEWVKASLRKRPSASEMVRTSKVDVQSKPR
jgi:hypothetical protein